MADSFFGFNTALSGLELDDGPEGDEEEYDALNNETFGSDAFQGDWESDHTRFAAVTEGNREYRHSFNSERDDEDLDLETTLSQLVLDEYDEDEPLEVVRQPTKVPSAGMARPPGALQGHGPSFWNHVASPKKEPYHYKQPPEHASHVQHPQQVTLLKHGPLIPPPMVNMQLLPPQLPRIPTVQELERDLMLKNKAKQSTIDKENRQVGPRGPAPPDMSRRVQGGPGLPHQPPPLQPPGLGRGKFLQQPPPPGSAGPPGPSGPPGPKFPPGFPPRALFPQMPQQEMVMARNKHNLMMMPPHLLPTHPMLAQHKGRLLPLHFLQPHPMLLQQHHLQHQVNQFKPNPMGVHPDGLRNGQLQGNHIAGNMQQRNHHQQQQQQQHNSSYNNHPWLHNPHRRTGDDVDEYAGLMNNRERQWLLNIQILQLQTDKPHVDDYYYTVWGKKQEKLKKERERNGLSSREPFFHNNRQAQAHQRDRRDSDREVQGAPQKVYEPLQFENSLGRLQCGSVTAPRKIIDMDIVSEPVEQSTPATSHKDSKRTKKMLLELERLYLMIMELEELEDRDLPFVPLAHPLTGLLEPETATKPELLSKITSVFLSPDKFLNFMCVRKGKALLLRVLPHLLSPEYRAELTEVWARTVRNLTAISRRDSTDLYLVKMYPYMKSWLANASYPEVSLLASQLFPANNNTQMSNSGRNSSRAVSPNPGKVVLPQAFTSKFGISLLSALVCHGEFLYPSLNEESRSDWCSFVSDFIKHVTNLPSVDSVPTPIHPIPSNVLSAMVSRNSDAQTTAKVLSNLSKSRS